MERADQLQTAPPIYKPLSPEKARGRRLRQNMPLLLMFIPVAVYFLIFKYFPMAGLVIAFKNYNFADGIWGSPWVGLYHFDMMLSSPKTVNVIKNTLLLSLLNIFVGFPFPIILAIMLNEVRKMWFKKTVQTLVYLPHFLSWVILGGMVVTIFSQQSGFLNHWIELWTGSPYPFLYKEFSWLSIFLGSGVWKEAGWSAIIYLAALTSIDPALYESASLDGAGKFRKIWHITLPGISGIIVLMFILSIGKVMEVGFDHVFVLQNKGVMNISDVISTYIYRNGLLGAKFSETTALGLFESVVGLILVLAANRIARIFGRGLW
ncbi:ABC transporter permease [Paenibacillus radicis (ex Xue et al. 2023)]|uniref:ABC transporter permease subunit n=1 Tax=Paenibacillus radicis (ex Xue et al. 2023) TaxID=2972489 RepID=A0ABT1Y9X0_9BACL|nr:ABC transporter permease subunit [Paenibacillus radicis (ex Xue et al. 2023)]MCR8629994.1 ABC transporter permease subunit [Paenibacillus radicis (ex Xue et al. 2023)]